MVGMEKGEDSRGHSNQFSSVAQSCPTFGISWTAACQASLFITNTQILLKLMSIESVMTSNQLILCRPLLLLLSIFLSIRVFSNESALRTRWPKYWSFSFNISPSNEYSGLISFRMNWFDLLAVQGTLKSLLQHHSSKASILHCTILNIFLPASVFRDDLLIRIISVKVHQSHYHLISLCIPQRILVTWPSEVSHQG